MTLDRIAARLERHPLLKRGLDAFRDNLKAQRMG